jgi:alkylation response protein AidB-like acyl-CoA dehydrogenase
VTASPPDIQTLCDDLRAKSGELETADAWPGQQFDLLAKAGVLGWVIPPEYGGNKVDLRELTIGYERLSAACLTTAFVLTQRNGACQRIAGCENEALKSELLPDLCAGKTFATVGISHLTTSRQHLRTPAIQVEQQGSRLKFDGTIPWVTGARHADYILTGGTFADGRQVLAVIPTAAANVSILPPPRMLALNASQTGAVKLDGVEIDERFLIAGPAEAVMKLGVGGGTGSLSTSALALGTAAGALELLREEAERRPDLQEVFESIAAERDDAAAAMLELSRGGTINTPPPHSAEEIRRRSNSIVLRATQAYLAASKGAGFVAGHPAERLVREAMFFLVWSCPQPVLAANLREFACLVET